MAIRPPPPPTRFGPTLIQRKGVAGVAPPPTRFGPVPAPIRGDHPARPVAARSTLQLMNINAIVPPVGKIKIKSIKAKKYKSKNGVIITEHSGVKISATVTNNTVNSFEVGFLQAVTAYSGVETYSNGRTYTYSFPNLPIKDAENIGDVFYDSKASKVIYSYNSDVINMNDQPDGTADWVDPRDITATLDRITRRQTFFVWLWARRVGQMDYIVLDRAQWGFDCAYDFTNNTVNDGPIYPALNDPGLQTVATQNMIANGSDQCVVNPP